jgi:hypothetical protein
LNIGDEKMKKYFRMAVVLFVIILLSSIGSAQASQSRLLNPTGASSIASAYPVEHWVTGAIYTQDSAGSHVSIAFDPDHDQAAWVSFYNETDGGLWTAHYLGSPAGNCGPDDTWLCEEVDQVASESKGLYTSIDVFPDTNPNPLLTTWKVGISYYDATHKSLKYAQYRCPVLDPCFWTIYTVHSPTKTGDNFGQYTSLKFDSTGIPHIAYYVEYDTGINSLAYAYFEGSSAGDCGDDSDWQCEDITWSSSPHGLYASLDVGWDDEIYIAYYNVEFQRLHYAATVGYGNCGPDTAWHCQDIDDPDGANVGLFPSMVAPQDAGDIFHVAYYDSTHGSLKYAYPRDDNGGNCGDSKFQCAVIDNMGAGLTWAGISMAVDSSHNPMIAYTAASGAPSSLSLRVAEMADGQPYANCGEGTWWCGTLDSGSTFIDEARYASLGIKPNGLAMIAYSSLGKIPPANYNLKFAYQKMWVFLPNLMK